MLVKLCCMKRSRRSAHGPFSESIILAINCLRRELKKIMIIWSCLKFLASVGKLQFSLSALPPPTCCLSNPMMNSKTQQALSFSSPIHIALLLPKLILKPLLQLQLLLQRRPSLVLLRRTARVLEVLRTSSSSCTIYLFDTC